MKNEIYRVILNADNAVENAIGSAGKTAMTVGIGILAIGATIAAIRVIR